MTLKDMILADSVNVFINSSEFAESVVYKNRQSKLVPITRTINAVVIRQVVGESEESGTSVPFFEVHVANNSTVGISSTEIDLGGDTIDIPVRPGMTASTRAIVAIIDQDEGMMVLQCQ
jgi:hypothetical protein